MFAFVLWTRVLGEGRPVYTCPYTANIGTKTVGYCLGQAPSYYRLSADLAFTKPADIASLVLDGQDAATELHLDLTISSSFPFSIFALGTSLRLENVSVSVESADIGEVRGMIPYSGATSVRNGRFEVTTQGDGCGVAGKLRGPVLLDSVYVGLEARGGAAVAFKAVMAQFKMIHCLFTEALQQGGVVLGEITGVVVEAWADSRYETTMFENNMFGDIVGDSVEARCSWNQKAPGKYTNVDAPIDCGGDCFNMDVTLNIELTNEEPCPFTNSALFRYLQVHGTAIVSTTGASLVTKNVATKIQCVKVTAAVPLTTYTFSLLLHQTQNDVTITNLVLNSTGAISTANGGVAAIDTAKHRLIITNAVVEGKYVTGEYSALLLRNMEAASAWLTIAHLSVNLSEYSVKGTSAILVHQLKASCVLTDLSVNYTQVDEQQLESFGGLVHTCASKVFTLFGITVTVSCSNLHNSGLVAHTTGANTTMSDISIDVMQSKQHSVTFSLFYEFSEALTDFNAAILLQSSHIRFALAVAQRLSAVAMYASGPVELRSCTAIISAQSSQSFAFVTPALMTHLQIEGLNLDVQITSTGIAAGLCQAMYDATVNNLELHIELTGSDLFGLVGNMAGDAEFQNVILFGSLSVVNSGSYHTLVGLVYNVQSDLTVQETELNLVLKSAAKAHLIAGTAYGDVTLIGVSGDSEVFGEIPFGGLVDICYGKLDIQDSNLNITIVNEQLGPAAVFVGIARTTFSFSFRNSTVYARGIFTQCGCLDGSCTVITPDKCTPLEVTVKSEDFEAVGSVIVNEALLSVQCALNGDFNWNSTIIVLDDVQKSFAASVASPFCPQPIFYNILVKGAMQVTASYASLLLAVSTGAVSITKATIEASLEVVNGAGAALVSQALADMLTVNDCVFTGSVIADKQAGGLVGSVRAGTLQLASPQTRGYVRCLAAPCGGVVAEVLSGASVTVNNGVFNGSVSGAYILGNLSLRPQLETGGVVGKMAGVFQDVGSVAQQSGVFQSQKCGSGACNIQSMGYTRKVVVADFTQVLSAPVQFNSTVQQYRYALGGQQDWNNSMVTMDEGIDTAGVYGLFAWYPYYANISVTMAWTSSASFELGALVGILGMDSRIEGCVVDIAITASNAKIAGFVYLASAQVVLYESVVQGFITAKNASSIAGIVDKNAILTIQAFDMQVAVVSSGIAGAVSVVKPSGVFACLASTLYGSIEGIDMVGLVAHLEANSRFAASACHVASAVTGTQWVGSYIGYSLASSVTLDTIMSDAIMNSGMSIKSGSIAGYIGVGMHTTKDITSNVVGQFGSCPVGYQSPYQFAATCQHTSYSFTSSPTRESASVANNLIGAYYDKIYYDGNYEYITYWLKTTNYNHSAVSISVEIDANGGNNYVSPFHYTYAWFEDILVSGELKYNFNYTSVGASILAFTNAPTTIVSCQSSMKHTQTYSDGGGLIIAGFVGIAVHPLSIYGCKSTVAYYCKTFGTNDGYSHNDFSAIIFENRNTLVIENTVSAGSQSSAETALMPDYVAFCYRCSVGSCTITNSVNQNGWSALKDGYCEIS